MRSRELLWLILFINFVIVGLIIWFLVTHPIVLVYLLATLGGIILGRLIIEAFLWIDNQR